MSRIGFVVAAASLLGVALAGCSSMLASNSASEQLQPLNFESDPPGAEVRTIQGQTCVTPCALSVPSQEQPVTISREGFVPQTVQVTTGPLPDHSFWEKPAPTLVPNPVRVVMQASQPAKPPKPAKPRRARSHAPRKPAPSAAAEPQPAQPSSEPSPSASAPDPSASSAAAAQPAPSGAPPQAEGSPFPPPPQAQPSGGDSAFPPPPPPSH